MTAHDQHHDDVLIRLLADADAPADSRLLEGTALQGCPVCAARLAEVPAVTELLDTLGRDARAGLSSSVVPAPPAVEAAFGERLRGLLAGAEPAAGPRARRSVLLSPGWWLALAAAGLAVLGARFWLEPAAPGEPTRAHVFLGAAAFPITVEEPMAGALTIRWEAEAPRGGAFRLTIWPADGLEPLLRAERLDATTWSPTAAEERRLHGELTVEVEVLGPGGTPVTASERTFERP